MPGSIVSDIQVPEVRDLKDETTSRVRTDTRTRMDAQKVDLADSAYHNSSPQENTAARRSEEGRAVRQKNAAATNRSSSSKFHLPKTRGIDSSVPYLDESKQFSNRKPTITGRSDESDRVPRRRSALNGDDRSIERRLQEIDGVTAPSERVPAAAQLHGAIGRHDGALRQGQSSLHATNTRRSHLDPQENTNTASRATPYVYSRGELENLARHGRQTHKNRRSGDDASGKSVNRREETHRTGSQNYAQDPVRAHGMCCCIRILSSF